MKAGTDFRQTTRPPDIIGGDQKIVLQTRPSDIGDRSDLLVGLSNVNLNAMAPFFLPNNRLEGLPLVIYWGNPGGHQHNPDDISTRFLRMDNDSIGN
jgi:hypothetical protein